MVKHPTLGFSSGYDLTVQEFKPRVRLCTDGTEPAWDSLSPSLPPTPHARVRELSLLLSLSLSQINLKKRSWRSGAFMVADIF